MTGRGARAALRLAATAGLLALVWAAADGAAALALLRAADPRGLLLAVLLLSAQTWLSALRWSMTARALSQPLPLRAALGEYYLGMLLNLTLPGGVLGDVGRALRTRGDAGGAAGLAASAQAVVIERLSGQLCLAAVLGAGLALWPAATPWGPWAAAAGVAAAAAGVVALAGGPPLLRRFGRALRRVWTPWPRGLAQGAVNLAILGCTVGAMAACSAAVGAPLGLSALVAVPLALLAMLVPVSVGGWGLREGAAVAVWPMAGHAAEAGFAASVAFGLCALAAALPGLAVALRPGRWGGRAAGIPVPR